MNISTVFLLSLHQAWQLYHTEGLPVPGHSVKAIMLRKVTKETDTLFILHASRTE
jgi:hypothetical protein